jgi:hypothetical protein
MIMVFQSGYDINTSIDRSLVNDQQKSIGENRVIQTFSYCSSDQF